MRIFLFDTAFRPALDPTQPPIQWLLGTPSLGIKRPGRESDHSHLSSAEVKEYVEPVPPLPMSWCSFKKAQGQIYLYLYVYLEIKVRIKITFTNKLRAD